MITIIIPGRLPGYNELTHGHWAKCQNIKDDAMELVGWVVKAEKVQPVRGKALVKITCFEPNKKRDPSNVRSGAEKVVLDALQNQGIIRNDNWRWLEDEPARVELDRKNSRVEVEILEVEACQTNAT